MIGIGVDIQSVKRTEELLSRSVGVMERMFSADEIEYCRSKDDPYVHFAGRFAAKEAVVKALSPSKELGNIVGDVVVSSGESGAPHCELKGKALLRFEEMGGGNVYISISHEEGIAIGFAVVE